MKAKLFDGQKRVGDIDIAVTVPIKDMLESAFPDIEILVERSVFYGCSRRKMDFYWL